MKPVCATGAMLVLGLCSLFGYAHGHENAHLADVTEQCQKMEQQHRLRQQRMHQHRAARMAEGTVAAVVAAPHKPTVAAVADTVPTPR